MRCYKDSENQGYSRSRERNTRRVPYGLLDISGYSARCAEFLVFLFVLFVSARTFRRDPCACASETIGTVAMIRREEG
jgi:hypothetical protein